MCSSVIIGMRFVLNMFYATLRLMVILSLHSVKMRKRILIVGIFVLLGSSFAFASSGNYEYYTVKEDDTIFGIIKRVYKLDWDYWKNIEKTIRKINGLEEDEDIYAGQRLIIPVKGGVWHEVKEGQGLWRIAWTYGVPEEDIRVINNISDRNGLKEGQKLFIPGAKEVLEIELPELARPNFCWPVKEGKVIKVFDGNSSKGIDIAVPGGTTIVASSKGKVILAGLSAGVGGIGGYILISHKDIGFYTCYTHISSPYTPPILLVKKGDLVEKGESIAIIEYPEEGDISYFHFEIRKANNPFEAVDPLKYLPKRMLLSEE
ncbi:LysM peptidoglycan-binding domain-containing protein [Candidatus Aerophobetes bacterium]|nr:LysM peptidoglycan-binding domain-containing protein [Candidatus Aerophobetes bacterium]